MRLSEPAEAEVDALYLRLSTVSPDSAARWHAGLLVAVASLAQLPYRCAFAPENDAVKRELRQLLYRHGKSVYRILFVVFDSDNGASGFVRILHVRNAAQRRLDENTGSGE